MAMTFRAKPMQRYDLKLSFRSLIVPATLGATLCIAAQTPPASKPASPPQTGSAALIDQSIARGIEHILSVQEGDDQSEWPYEGVYRVGGKIPVGYRIGGTGICAMALMQAPGYAADPQRHKAIERAVRFIIKGADDPLMSPDYQGGYDVRGWGYTYGLALLLQMKATDAVPGELRDQVDATIKRDIQAIQQTEIAEVGGWNYARAQGKNAVSPPSPFMTAPTLQMLFQARKLGYQIDEAVVNRALQTLERARTSTGSIVYSGIKGHDSKEPVPGAVGRMLAAESTLYLAGRSNIANVRGAVDAFIVHWEWLNKRRAQQGTHVAPYGIAPYYFYYAHYFAAQAVEMLPPNERAEYRRRINDLLFSVQLNDGTWNDRVFPRSSNYGTAMAIMALMMPKADPPARFEAAVNHKDLP
jgi:hypothetical protein